MYTFFYKHYVYKRIQAQVWKWFFIDKPSLYFLCSFYWYFSKIFWWFYFNEIYNCCVFASLPVYHFGWNLTAVYYVGWNLTASLFIPSSPSIWNSRVHCIKTCSQWRVFLCFSARAVKYTKPENFKKALFESVLLSEGFCENLTNYYTDVSRTISNI